MTPVTRGEGEASEVGRFNDKSVLKLDFIVIVVIVVILSSSICAIIHWVLLGIMAFINIMLCSTILIQTVLWSEIDLHTHCEKYLVRFVI